MCKEERKRLVEAEGTSKKTTRRKAGVTGVRRAATSVQRASRTPNKSTTITRSQSGKGVVHLV